MPGSVRIEIPAADIAKLQGSIATLRREMGLSLVDSLKLAARAVSRSIAASTRIAPKRRPTHLKVTAVDRYGKRGQLLKRKELVKRWGVFSYFGGQQRWVVLDEPTPKGKAEANRHPRAQITNRGLAKAAWWWAGKKSGDSGIGAGGADGKTQSAARRFGESETHLNGSDPYIVIRSKLSYAKRALANGPRDVNQAVGRAARGMLARMRETMKRAGAKT